MVYRYLLRSVLQSVAFSLCLCIYLGCSACSVQSFSSCGLCSPGGDFSVTEHGLGLVGLVAPWHVGSSQTRGQTHVPCIGRQVLNYWTTGGVPLFETLLSGVWGVYPEAELLDHRVILCLLFWEIAILFSTIAVPFYIPVSSLQGFQILHILTSTFYFLGFVLDSSHSNECEVMPHSSALLFLRISEVEHLFMCLLASHVSFLDMEFFVVEFQEFLIYAGY